MFSKNTNFAQNQNRDQKKDLRIFRTICLIHRKLLLNLMPQSSEFIYICMKIKDIYKHIDGQHAWETVVDHVLRHRQITSVTGIVFDATFVGSCIFIKGGTPGTKRADKGEYITGKDFIHAYDMIKEWDVINTGNVKPHIKRQQTPFIALLLSTGILEQ